MIEMDEEAEYKIVGSTEANPEEHRISNESPVGSSLINKKVGDIVEVTVPDGLISFKVLDIHK
jgi:transcription elongation factor GreA